jgi:hypothetical protein
METIFLNVNNIIEGSKNSRLNYKFANQLILKKNCKIALKSLNMYYSWFNINSNLYQNNTFQYKWWDENGDLTVVVDVVIPDGNYSVSTLNEYLRKVMYSNKHYLKLEKTGSPGEFDDVYFIELTDNETFYKFQVNLGYMPDSTSYNTIYGYTQPTGATWSLPDTGSPPQIIFPSSNNFYKLLGFTPNTYPLTVTNSSVRLLGDIVPQIDPVSTILMTCNMVTNEYTVPDNLLYSFVNTSAFGSSLRSEPSILSFSNVNAGSYTGCQIQFYDQDYRPMEILDPQMTITLILDLTNSIEDEK